MQSLPVPVVVKIWCTGTVIACTHSPYEREGRPRYIGRCNKNANEAYVQNLHEKSKITDFLARNLTHHTMIFLGGNALKFTYGYLYYKKKFPGL